MKIDFSIYIVHAAFWSAFGITLIVLRSLERKRCQTVRSRASRQRREDSAILARIILMCDSGMKYLSK